MFDLESAITEWRKQMLAAGIKAPVPLEELESHLREEIAQQLKSTSNEQEAFHSAVKKIGEAPKLRMEFNKAGIVLETRFIILAGAACLTVALFFSLWTLPFLFHHEAGSLSKGLGLAAVAATVLGWRYSHTFLPAIRNQRSRTMIGLACWLGCVVWMLLFINNFLPYMMLHPAGNDMPAGHLMAVFLWGWAVMATLGGIGRGLEKAAGKKTA
jgi:hypothetical protein